MGDIIWNFRFPNAIPLAHVIAAVMLSFVSVYLKKFNKIYDK
tara:strand:- start:535 stop:660 length:126 start_codon:yes stop_codon:yes gene_type:complete